jgi:polyketide synthase 12/myxalamid-type polyketide synthase MxaB
MAFQTVGRVQPSVGEVEISIHAAGLNFRDVLNALGIYPGEAGPLGLECSGKVSRIGPGGVEGLAVGDRVMAIAPGCLGPLTLTDGRLVAPIPDDMTFAEGATIPIVFLTVEYALRRLAGLKQGDTLLVHSAAGGVGLAALQVARRTGARVIATAGSDEKRQYVRELGVEHVFDSRNLDFAQRVLEATGGRGVDVVLNALPGEYVVKNLDALTTGGRFVEIGKSQTWETERLAEKRPDVRYHTFALDELAVHQPSAVGELLQQLVADFAGGTYRPLPQTSFEIDEVKEAFRTMAQARHIGKVIVVQEDAAVWVDESQKIKENATYLITGGLGGIGLLVARWLAERGARHLVLLSRRPPTEDAQRALEELEGAGVTVVTRQADVSVRRDLRRVFDLVRSSMPPLKGIMHAAGLLDDDGVLQQQWSRFKKVMDPKVRGALHLQEMTQEMDLDWLVLFSSAASVWGSPGQSNYAAANAVLDSLASARRLAGQPAISINWGPWSEVGMAARMVRVARPHWWEMVGIGMIPPAQGMTVLEMILNSDPTQIAVMPIDWSKLMSQLPPGSSPPLLRDLLESQQKSLEPSKQWLEFVEKLKQAPPAERVDLLVRHIQDEASRVLGLDPDAPLDPHLPLNDLGFDSLMAVELANQLTASTGIALPVTLLFDYPTIHAISGYFVREVLGLDTGAPDHAAEADEPRTASVAETTKAMLRSIEQLSDQDVVDRLELI